MIHIDLHSSSLSENISDRLICVFTTILTVLEVNNASLAVGCVAAVRALVGHLLSGDAFRDNIGLVSDLLGWGPDRLPVSVLGTKRPINVS